MKKALFAIILGLILPFIGTQPMNAQESKYKFDVGASLGISGYLGDANQSNLFKNIGFAGGASFRYLIDTRWALRGVFTTASLSGNTADWDNALPEGKQYEFSSQVYDLGFRGEFNFFGYGIGETYKKLRRWTPYISLGIGASLATCDGENAFAVNIPMGLGVKYKLKPRLNLGLEFCMTKVFGDKVDGKNLNDLYQIKSSFVKNTDWYSTILFSVTYEFGERCSTCHYVD